MGTCKRTEGQTLIETALMLSLLLLILLGITEFSRAWFTKNSLKNAVRQGARVAAVTLNTSIPTSEFKCINPACPIGDAIQNAICCQPGIPKEVDNDTTAIISCKDKSGSDISCSSVPTGGEVEVIVNSEFNFVIGGYHFSFLGLRIWPWPNSITMTTDASMRYEL